MFKRYKYVDTRQYMRLPAAHMLRYRILDKEIKMEPGEGCRGNGISFVANKEIPESSLVEMEISSSKAPTPIMVLVKAVSVKKMEPADAYKINAQFIKFEQGTMEDLAKMTKGKKSDDNQKLLELSPQYFSVKHNILESKDASTSVTKDISAGGISFIANRDFVPSSLIDLEISFPAVTHPVKAVARVVRAEPIKQHNMYKVAAQFVHIDENDKKAIDDFIKETLGDKPKRAWWWRKLK